MPGPDREFYEEWAKNQSANPLRETILKWKAVNMANLVLRTLKDEPINSVCEIGGAEGVVLSNVSSLLGAKTSVNFELSSEFCQIGAARYPESLFINSEFKRDSDPYDMIILSDIIEHIEDENGFLQQVSQACRCVVVKLPVEICLTQSHLYYMLRGRRKPKELQYGPAHINGHLRGYTLRGAYRTLAKHFDILDSSISDVTCFYGSSGHKMIQKCAGTLATIWMFGGALFVLGRGRTE